MTYVAFQSCIESFCDLLFFQFNDMANVPFQSKAFVAGIIAFFLDNTMHKKDGQTRKDRGKHWWDKFKSFKTDTRSEEFYSLPFNLNKYFPSVWFGDATETKFHTSTRVLLSPFPLKLCFCGTGDRGREVAAATSIFFFHMYPLTCEMKYKIVFAILKKLRTTVISLSISYCCKFMDMWI